MFHAHHISVPDIFLNYNYSQRSSLQLSVDLQTCSAGILGSVFTCELWTWTTVTSICLWGRLEIDTDMLQSWQKNAELMWERRADGIYLSTGAFLQDKHWGVPPWRQPDCVCVCFLTGADLTVGFVPTNPYQLTVIFPVLGRAGSHVQASFVPTCIPMGGWWRLSLSLLSALHPGEVHARFSNISLNLSSVYLTGLLLGQGRKAHLFICPFTPN